MSRTAINKNLLVDENQAPDKQGIINLGKNCSKCNELDFLPFKCEFCNLVYCSNHRTLESHQCPGKDQFEKGKEHVNYTGPTAASLFPNREVDKQRIDSLISKPKPTNILEKQFRLGDIAAKTPNAFSTFNKFLNLQKSKKGKSTISRLFAKSSKASTNKVVEISTLRKTAKGDTKISASDRIYLWCLYVNPHKSESESSESESFEKINIEQDRKPIFVSKNWPVGRALDSIADNLHIQNFNNSTKNSEERLHIFKLIDEKPILIGTSDRCIKSFKNGDIIYLVKGII